MTSLSEMLISVGNGHLACLVNKPQKPSELERAKDISLEGQRVNNGRSSCIQGHFLSKVWQDKTKNGGGWIGVRALTAYIFLDLIF